MPRYLVLALTALATLAGGFDVARAAPADAGTTWVCAYARTTPLPSCFLHAMDSQARFEACEARAAKLPSLRPRFRVGDGPWLDFPDTGWRCAPIPADSTDRARLQVENRGARVAGWALRVPKGCVSGVLDLVGPNDYGAMWTKCSRRDTAHDDRVPIGR